METSGVPQIRPACSAIVFRTGWISVGELAMTWRISLAAVSRSKAAMSSLLDSASCRRNSAIVCANLAGDSLTLRLCGLSFLFLEPFLVVAIEAKRRRLAAAVPHAD